MPRSERTGKAESARETQVPSVGLEGWSYAAFLLGGWAAALFVLLGLKPGGELPVLAYRWGMLALSGIALVGLLAAILWGFLRRPVLQRRRWIPLAVLSATLWATSLPLPYPSSHEGHPSSTTFELPLDGASQVLFSGELAQRDPLALDPARRFGVVLESAEQGAPVRSPASGRIHTRAAVEGRLAVLGLAGERLLIEVSADEFLVLEGLADPEPGLLPGSDVGAGEVLGRLSGTRLALFLVDGTDLDRCEGIPMRFSIPRGGVSGRQGLPVGPIGSSEGGGGAGQR